MDDDERVERGADDVLAVVRITGAVLVVSAAIAGTIIIISCTLLVR